MKIIQLKCKAIKLNLRPSEKWTTSLHQTFPINFFKRKEKGELKWLVSMCLLATVLLLLIMTIILLKTLQEWKLYMAFVMQFNALLSAIKNQNGKETLVL